MADSGGDRGARAPARRAIPTASAMRVPGSRRRARPVASRRRAQDGRDAVRTGSSGTPGGHLVQSRRRARASPKCQRPARRRGVGGVAGRGGARSARSRRPRRPRRRPRRRLRRRRDRRRAARRRRRRPRAAADDARAPPPPRRRSERKGEGGRHRPRTVSSAGCAAPGPDRSCPGASASACSLRRSSCTGWRRRSACLLIFDSVSPETTV